MIVVVNATDFAGPLDSPVKFNAYFPIRAWNLKSGPLVNLCTSLSSGLNYLPDTGSGSYDAGLGPPSINQH